MSSKPEKTATEEMKAPKRGVGTTFFESFTWFVSFVVGVVGCFAFIWVMAASFIPWVGNMLIMMSGIGYETSVAEVMAVWLVPQLFIAGLCVFATIAFCKWWWQTCKNLAEKVNAIHANASEKSKQRSAEKCAKKEADAKEHEKAQKRVDAAVKASQKPESVEKAANASQVGSDTTNVKSEAESASDVAKSDNKPVKSDDKETKRGLFGRRKAQATSKSGASGESGE